MQNQEVFEKFRTDTAYRIHIEGHTNISFKNPLLPSRIFGYSPFLTTAFDVNLPDKAATDSFNKVRLWRVG